VLVFRHRFWSTETPFWLFWFSVAERMKAKTVLWFALPV
jgi:hypothetical protein